MRIFLSLALFFVFAGDTPYIRDVQTWRQNYEESLRAPNGWLSVAGLTWLHEGENSMGTSSKCDILLPPGGPAHAAPLILQNGEVRYEGHLLRPDTSGVPDVLTFGDITLTIIKRGDRLGARLRDPNAPTRLNFTGSKWYPIDPQWRVEAKWVNAPQHLSIVNVLGMKEDQVSPGYAEFTLKGVSIRLRPIMEDNQLFFIFKDQTSGKSTYGAGRYLYAALPENGKVILDFNEAKNPPCAFTAYATCPLPPKANVVPIAFEAGEKRYGNH